MIEKLMKGHLRFRKQFEADKAAFLRLAQEGQKPRVLWIGCSDSRVIPEQIAGAGPGELFVLRNIANIVPPFGTMSDAVGGVIEYAVRHLKVSEIVVCGHTECGGIKALEGKIDAGQEPCLARWIELARPALVQTEAAKADKKARYEEVIKANIRLQRRHLLTYGCVREKVEAGRLKLHAWLYDLRTGRLMVYDDDSGKWRDFEAP